MRKEKIILICVATVSLVVGGVAGIFLSSHLDFSNSKNLTSENKNVVYVDDTYKENEYFKELDKVFNDINKNGNKLRTTAAANKKKAATNYYKQIASDIDEIKEILNIMVAGAERDYFVVQGNTSTISKTKTLMVYPNNSTYKNFRYSFDGGKTWQTSNKKTFTKNQTVKIMVEYEGGYRALQTHKITTIDNAAPTIKYSWDAKQYKDGYKLPAGLKVTCVDSKSNIKYIAFDKNKYANEVKSRTQTESIGFVGSSRTTDPITITCSDSVGNIAKVIVPKYKLYK